MDRGGMIEKFFAGNHIIAYAVRKEFRKKNYFKAAALALYSLPLRKIISLENSFITAPREYYAELHELLHVSKVNGFGLVRIGRDYDGGYIMLDDFASDDKIAYSFGISDDVSWDKEMAARGYDVFMYDHTIEKLPEENSRFHFFKKGLADSKNPSKNLKPLEYFIEQNHHEDKRDMILKMDVEGAEWGFIENVKHETLSQFSQILLEIHGINDPKYHAKIPQALRKINETHKLIHIHGQNHGYCVSLGTQIFCNQIEAAYVRRDKYNLVEDYDVKLPLDIDMPAHDCVPEIALGYWNRKIKPDDKFTSITEIL